MVEPKTDKSQEPSLPVTDGAEGTQETVTSGSSDADPEEAAHHKDTDPPAPLPYNAPRWSGTPTNAFSLMVVKTGVVVDTISLEGRPYLVFGRLPSCHVTLEHPSISRYHAVVQYKPHSSEVGWQEGEHTAPSAGAQEVPRHHTQTHTHTRARAYTCKHTHARMHMHTCTHTHAHTHACTHTHTHACTRTHTHAHMHVHVGGPCIRLLSCC